jgi:hypothetical protein
MRTMLKLAVAIFLVFGLSQFSTAEQLGGDSRFYKGLGFFVHTDMNDDGTISVSDASNKVYELGLVGMGLSRITFVDGIPAAELGVDGFVDYIANHALGDTIVLETIYKKGIRDEERTVELVVDKIDRAYMLQKRDEEPTHFTSNSFGENLVPTTNGQQEYGFEVKSYVWEGALNEFHYESRVTNNVPGYTLYIEFPSTEEYEALSNGEAPSRAVFVDNLFDTQYIAVSPGTTETIVATVNWQDGGRPVDPTDYVLWPYVNVIYMRNPDTDESLPIEQQAVVTLVLLVPENLIPLNKRTALGREL